MSEAKILTAVVIRAALKESNGSRAEAAKLLDCSADTLRISIRRFRDRGYEFPKPQNEIARQVKCSASLQVGRWVETGQDQQCGEILAIEGGRALVQFSDDVAEWLPVRQIAWVPSGDVIAEATRKIREGWPESEFYKRAPWALRRVYEIPQVGLEEDSREETW